MLFDIITIVQEFYDLKVKNQFECLFPNLCIFNFKGAGIAQLVAYSLLSPEYKNVIPDGIEVRYAMFKSLAQFYFL